jgi:hypothetical protein
MNEVNNREIAENDRSGGESVKAEFAHPSRAEDNHTIGSAPPAGVENTRRPSAPVSTSEKPQKMTAIPIFFRPKFYAVLVVLIGALIGAIAYLLWF